MMDPRELQAHIRDVALASMKILATSIDAAIDKFMSGGSDEMPVTPELFSWFIQFLTVQLTETELQGNVALASEIAAKLSIMFTMIDTAATTASGPAKEQKWEMLAQTKDNAIDFLTNRPTVPAIEQTYSGIIPKSLIETHGLII